MKKSILYNIGEKIKIEEVDSISEENKVSVKVRYAALNHRDLWIQKGQYAGLKFPITLGSDACVLYNSIKGKNSIVLGKSELSVREGVYYYTLETAGFTETKKMIIAR